LGRQDLIEELAGRLDPVDAPKDLADAAIAEAHRGIRAHDVEHHRMRGERGRDAVDIDVLGPRRRVILAMLQPVPIDRLQPRIADGRTAADACLHRLPLRRSRGTALDCVFCTHRAPNVGNRAIRVPPLFPV
jgi:hypothetical protein